ncbi:MAG TPA: hypothetical protein VE177_08410, partial [Candidatus Binatus sp.]|nr:hypothetical protein [Candidatus Binatus sp.]
MSCSSQTAGTYILSITANGSPGTASHSTSVAFNFMDFTVTATSVSPISPNEVGNSTVTATSLNGYTGNVTLTVAVSPSTGLTCNLSPKSILLGSSGNSILSCIASTVGLYSVTVTGSSNPSHVAIVSITVQDFTISASPSSLSMHATFPGTSTITVTGQSGFTGTVTLTSRISPTTGLACTLSPSTISLGSSGTSTLSCNGSVGNYNVTVTGSSGQLSHSVLVTSKVNDFSMAANPTRVSAFAGANSNSTVTFTALNGFTGTIGLTYSSSPVGLSCAFSPASVSLGNSATSTLSCKGSAGNYNATVTGTIGSLSRSVVVAYTVQDFGLSASISTVTTIATRYANSTLTVTSMNGFTGTVTLSLSPPSGLFSSLNVTSISGSGAASLSAASNLGGNYTLTVTASSGSLSHSITVKFVVSDFTVSTAGPLDFNMGATSGTSTSVTLTSVNSFSGTANLAAFSSPAGVTLQNGVCGSTNILPGSFSTATCTFTSTSPGTYSLTIQVTVQVTSSFSLTRQSTLTVHVGDFSISSIGRDLNVGQGGVSASVTVTSRFDFTGTVNVTGTATPFGLTATCQNTNLTPNSTQTISCGLNSLTPGTYLLTISGTAVSGTANHQTGPTTIHVGDFTITVTGVNLNTGQTGVSVKISVRSSFNFAGTITLSGTAAPAGLVVCPSFTLILTANATVPASCSISSSSPGTYSVSIDASGAPGSASHQASSVVHVGDFTISVSNKSVNPGQTGVSTLVTISSFFNFNGSVTLSGSSVPSTLTVTCDGPVIITPNATATASCGLSSSTAGTYTISVRGTASLGTASHSASATVTVGNVSLSVAPGRLNLGQAGIAAVVTVKSDPGFNGNVTLTGTSPNGLSVSCPTGAIPISSNSTVTAMCALSSTIPGTYLVTVTGVFQPGTVVQSTQTTVHVGDFNVTSSTVNMNIGQGGKSALITLTSLSNFNGTVSLTGNAAPAGLTVSCNTTFVLLTPNSTAVGSCSLASTRSGTYTVTIIAQGSPGTASHSTVTTVHVG